MAYIHRAVESQIDHALREGMSVLLLGPRQTGKTTLLNRLPADMRVSLADPTMRLRYERDPGILIAEVRQLKGTNTHAVRLFLDEVQKVPQLMDAVQVLIDERSAQCVLTGSSALKLRRGADVNLLPGRALLFRLDPLTLEEDADVSLKHRLVTGTLPGILSHEDNPALQEQLLQAYVTTYLEEEIRAEAQVRKMGPFSHFLELAASESGNVLNFKKLADEVGVANTTIRGYYSILEDSLLIERIRPFWRTRARRLLTKSCKFLFFDLGIRRVAAGEGRRPSRERWGQWFEQYVGLELVRLARLQSEKTNVRFWRDPHGPEVDWLLEREGRLVPVEVKWTDLPRDNDARHLRTFLREESSAARGGYLICRTPRPVKMDDHITALPWQRIGEVFDGF